MRAGLTGCRRAPGSVAVLLENQPNTSTSTSAVPTLPEILTVTFPLAPRVRMLRFGTVWPALKLSTLEVPAAAPDGYTWRKPPRSGFVTVKLRATARTSLLELGT